MSQIRWTKFFFEIKNENHRNAVDILLIANHIKEAAR